MYPKTKIANLGRVFWEPFWNESTWNYLFIFSLLVLIPESLEWGGMIGMIWSECHLIKISFGAEWTEWPQWKSCQSLGYNDLGWPKQQRIGSEFEFCHRPQGRKCDQFLIVPTMSILISKAYILNSRRKTYKRLEARAKCPPILWATLCEVYINSFNENVSFTSATYHSSLETNSSLFAMDATFVLHSKLSCPELISCIWTHWVPNNESTLRLEYQNLANIFPFTRHFQNLVPRPSLSCEFPHTPIPSIIGQVEVSNSGYLPSRHWGKWLFWYIPRQWKVSTK